MDERLEVLGKVPHFSDLGAFGRSDEGEDEGVVVEVGQLEVAELGGHHPVPTQTQSLGVFDRGSVSREKGGAERKQ